MTEIPPDPGLLSLRRAVARVRYLNDWLIWQTLGIPLAEELARVEASWLTAAPAQVSEASRYVADHIDDAIRDFTTIKGLS